MGAGLECGQYDHVNSCCVPLRLLNIWNISLGKGLNPMFCSGVRGGTAAKQIAQDQIQTPGQALRVVRFIWFS